MYDDYIGGQPSATARSFLASQAQQDVDELNSPQQHIQQQGIQAHLQSKTVADNVPNAMFDANTKPDISFLYVFEALCYLKNDREDIWKLGAKGDIGFFIGYSADSCAYRVYNRRSKKIIKTMNVSFDELSAIAFEQRSSKPGLQSKLDLLFEAMYDDYIGGQPSATARSFLASQAQQDVDELNSPQQHIQQQGIQAHLQSKTVADNVPNAMFDANTPDIVHATCLCARYPAKPTEKHLKEVKRIFHYLRGTINTGLWYLKDSSFELTRFSNADYAGCKDIFKSTFGGAKFLGEKLLMDYGFHFNKIPIYYDSKSAIATSCNAVQHSRTKHIAIRFHFIKEHVEKGTIELYFVKMDYQLADLFTKALPPDRFNYVVRRLGMRNLSPQELDRLAKS
nr:hypothetical protein [Tanacetum cinerariifolium]